jgi:glycosyltransferase involved in cell wall biosynthesis
VDAVDVYERWKSGEHTKLFGTSYLMQFYALCSEIGASAFIITTLPGRFERQQIDNVIVENRPPPKAGGLTYHLLIVWQMLALAPALFRFRPSAFIVTAYANYWFALAYVRLFGTEIIPSAHCVLWRPFCSNPLHWRFLHWLDGLFLRLFVNRAMAISGVVAEQLMKLSKKKTLDVAIVTPTYRPGHFDAIRAPAHDRRPFRVLFNGRIETNKGVFDLLAVAARLHRERGGEFHFDICGDGEELERLRRTVVEQSLADTMHVHGFCEKDRMSHLLAASHVVVVPTRSDFEEGLAKSCVEAVLAGRPFISSPVCPALEALGAAAIGVPPDDVTGYYEAIIALSDDPVLYHQKAHACKALQDQFYDESESYQAVLRRHLVSAGIYAGEGSDSFQFGTATTW